MTRNLNSGSPYWNLTLKSHTFSSHSVEQLTLFSIRLDGWLFTLELRGCLKRVVYKGVIKVSAMTTQRQHRGFRPYSRLLRHPLRRLETLDRSNLLQELTTVRSLELAP